jgi:hypothetical protein
VVSRRLEGAALAAVLAVLAALAAGCGGGSGKPGVAALGTSATTTTTTPAPGGSGPAAGGSGGSGGSGGLSLKTTGGFAFSACMRSHGLPNFPDPNAQGALSIDSASGIDPSSPTFQAAQRACAKDLPGGGSPPSPAEQQKMEQWALRFSACMRTHGVPNFPDPSFANGGIGIKIDPSTGIDPRAPRFQAAQKQCRGNGPPGLRATGAVRVTP